MDIRGLGDICDFVKFGPGPGQIEVYPEDAVERGDISKPSRGRGLNRPAVVTLEGIFPPPPKNSNGSNNQETPSLSSSSSSSSVTSPRVAAGNAMGSVSERRLLKFVRRLEKKCARDGAEHLGYSVATVSYFLIELDR